jgi:mono/diheme cytochrome c family protein
MRRLQMANRADWRWPLMLLPLAVTLAAGPVPPDQPGDPAAGHRLAKTWCSSCHVVDSSQTTGSATGAPPFPAVARMSSTTPISLRVFLQTPHARMPNLQLSRDEIDDVIAYILSLKKE